MITSALISFVLFILSFAFSLLPTSTGAPEGIVEAFEVMAVWLNNFNYYLPMETLFDLLVYAIFFELGLFAADFVFWVIKKLRGA